MNTTHLLYFFTFFINRFKAVEQKYTAKAQQAEAIANAAIKARLAHLEEAAKASRIGQRIAQIIE